MLKLIKKSLSFTLALMFMLGMVSFAPQTVRAVTDDYTLDGVTYKSWGDELTITISAGQTLQIENAYDGLHGSIKLQVNGNGVTIKGPDAGLVNHGLYIEVNKTVTKLTLTELNITAPTGQHALTYFYSYMVLDLKLNSVTLRGGDGSNGAAGGNGGDGINTSGAPPSGIAITGSGSSLIAGGDGGDSTTGNAGVPGFGCWVISSLTIGANVTIQGGNGGESLTGYSYSRPGIFCSNGTVTIASPAAITGGNGGSSPFGSGGASGIHLNNWGTVVINAAATITGGDGISGTDGGMGGSGLQFVNGGSAVIDAPAKITGGRAGAGSNNHPGGFGIRSNGGILAIIISNRADITGGPGTLGSGGGAGIGCYIQTGVITVSLTGGPVTVTGGAGGSSAAGGLAMDDYVTGITFDGMTAELIAKDGAPRAGTHAIPASRSVPNSRFVVLPASASTDDLLEPNPPPITVNTSSAIPVIVKLSADDKFVFSGALSGLTPAQLYGLEVSYSVDNAPAATAPVDILGQYAVIDLLNGVKIVATPPSVSGYTVAPASRTVTISGADITGQDFVYTPISPPVPIPSGGGYNPPPPQPPIAPKTAFPCDGKVVVRRISVYKLETLKTRLFYLNKGEEFRILGLSENGRAFQIEQYGRQGFVGFRDISATFGAPIKATAIKKGYVYIKQENGKLKRDGYFPKDTVLTITGISGKYLENKRSNITYWLDAAQWKLWVPEN